MEPRGGGVELTCCRSDACRPQQILASRHRSALPGARPTIAEESLDWKKSSGGAQYQRWSRRKLRPTRKLSSFDAQGRPMTRPWVEVAAVAPA
jgi:hypothetical protein